MKKGFRHCLVLNLTPIQPWGRDDGSVSPQGKDVHLRHWGRAEALGQSWNGCRQDILDVLN
jgi:hypothetical protein